MHATCQSNPILLDLITLIMFGRSWDSSLSIATRLQAGLSEF
jgi:hypothetical protein